MVCKIELKYARSYMAGFTLGFGALLPLYIMMGSVALPLLAIQFVSSLFFVAYMEGWL